MKLYGNYSLYIEIKKRNVFFYINTSIFLVFAMQKHSKKFYKENHLYAPKFLYCSWRAESA